MRRTDDGLSMVSGGCRNNEDLIDKVIYRLWKAIKDSRFAAEDIEECKALVAAGEPDIKNIPLKIKKELEVYDGWCSLSPNASKYADIWEKHNLWSRAERDLEAAQKKLQESQELQDSLPQELVQLGVPEQKVEELIEFFQHGGCWNEVKI